VSSGANARDMAAAGIDWMFDETVDGAEVAAQDLPGKPAPDGFLEAARRLAVASS